MTKKIAVINDLSGFGKCSLTAAVSAIAAMGVQPCPLPTAVLSAQTGYPSYYCVRGKVILQPHGKEFFTWYSKHLFTLHGKHFFT